MERALATLVRRATDAPAALGPHDLGPLRALVGDGALELALVLATFHFVNRVADQLGVRPDGPWPASARRVEPVRRTAVRLMSLLMRRIDLRPRPYAGSYADACAAFAAAVGRDVGAALAPLRPRPQLVEACRLMVDDRRRSSLDAATLARVDAVVASALPHDADDVHGFPPRPADPVDAFAFVGTRWAARTTPAMVDALRAAGMDDLGILDLAIAVADANAWARLWRLLALPADALAAAAGD